MDYAQDPFPNGSRLPGESAHVVKTLMGLDCKYETSGKICTSFLLNYHMDKCSSAALLSKGRSQKPAAGTILWSRGQSSPQLSPAPGEGAAEQLSAQVTQDTERFFKRRKYLKQEKIMV